MKIYTKTGDKGETSLLGGRRVKKSNKRVAAYGDIDELNSLLGLLRSELESKTPANVLLQTIQQELFVYGSHLASENQAQLPKIDASLQQKLEISMDEMSQELLPLKSFILPGGVKEASLCHLARTVCRRTERSVVELQQLDPVDPLILIGLNRLSDYLFVLARYLNFKKNQPDVLWTP